MAISESQPMWTMLGARPAPENAPENRPSCTPHPAPKSGSVARGGPGADRGAHLTKTGKPMKTHCFFLWNSWSLLEDHQKSRHVHQCYASQGALSIENDWVVGRLMQSQMVLGSPVATLSQPAVLGVSTTVKDLQEEWLLVVKKSISKNMSQSSNHPK